MTCTPQQALEKFAAHVWAPDDLVEARCLPTQRNGGPGPKSFWIPAGRIPGHFSTLESLNQQGLNIYAGVCSRSGEGGASDADALPGRVVWSDFDHTKPRDAWARATGKGLPDPTMAVNSGHGAHLYWRLEAPASTDRLSRLVGDLAALVGSDRSVRNPSRIMRLPGFQNLKEPAAPCELLFVKPDNQYNFEDIRKAVPEQQPPQAAQDQPGVPRPEAPGDAERARKYLAKIPGSHPGGRTDAGFKAAAILINDFSLPEATALQELEAWDAASNTPTIAEDYGPEELQRLIQNAVRYGKKPPGCKVTAPKAAPRKNQLLQPSQEAIGVTTLQQEFEMEERGESRTISLPWPRLSSITRALRPGTVSILAGPAGHGKSMLAMQTAVHVKKQGEAFSFMILEDRRVDFERRLLAHLADTWSVLDDDPEKARQRLGILHLHEEELAEIAAGVMENPRLPVKGEDGRLTVRPLPYQDVLDWVSDTLKNSRLAIIDPIAQIDFGEPQAWKGEKDFMRRIVGIAADARGNIVLIAHTVKRSGAAKMQPLCGDDIQGAAEIKRLVHNVLILAAHDPKTSDVWRAGGCREAVEHDRTLIVDKARNGSGNGARLAFKMDGPGFTELGIIAPKEKRVTIQNAVSGKDRAYKD